MNTLRVMLDAFILFPSFPSQLCSGDGWRQLIMLPSTYFLRLRNFSGIPRHLVEHWTRLSSWSKFKCLDYKERQARTPWNTYFLKHTFLHRESDYPIVWHGGWTCITAPQIASLAYIRPKVKVHAELTDVHWKCSRAESVLRWLLWICLEEAGGGGGCRLSLQRKNDEKKTRKGNNKI